MIRLYYSISQKYLKLSLHLRYTEGDEVVMIDKLCAWSQVTPKKETAYLSETKIPCLVRVTDMNDCQYPFASQKVV